MQLNIGADPDSPASSILEERARKVFSHFGIKVKGE